MSAARSAVSYSRVTFEKRNAPMRFPFIGFLDSVTRNGGWLRHAPVHVECPSNAGVYTLGRARTFAEETMADT